MTPDVEINDHFTDGEELPLAGCILDLERPNVTVGEDFVVIRKATTDRASSPAPTTGGQQGSAL